MHAPLVLRCYRQLFITTRVLYVYHSKNLEGNRTFKLHERLRKITRNYSRKQYQRELQKRVHTLRVTTNFELANDNLTDIKSRKPKEIKRNTDSIWTNTTCETLTATIVLIYTHIAIFGCEPMLSFMWYYHRTKYTGFANQFHPLRIIHYFDSIIYLFWHTRTMSLLRGKQNTQYFHLKNLLTRKWLQWICIFIHYKVNESAITRQWNLCILEKNE